MNGIPTRKDIELLARNDAVLHAALTAGEQHGWSWEGTLAGAVSALSKALGEMREDQVKRQQEATTPFGWLGGHGYQFYIDLPQDVEDKQKAMERYLEHHRHGLLEGARDVSTDPDFVDRQNRLMYEDAKHRREYVKRMALYSICQQPFFG